MPVSFCSGLTLFPAVMLVVGVIIYVTFHSPKILLHKAGMESTPTSTNAHYILTVKGKEQHKYKTGHQDKYCHSAFTIVSVTIWVCSSGIEPCFRRIEPLKTYVELDKWLDCFKSPLKHTAAASPQADVEI